MLQPPLEELFERYRRQGDLEALAEVFDRTALTLLRLAQHMVRVDAEDLVQDTFVTAIEHAGRYDARRPLLPWLAGILGNLAARRKREQRRSEPLVRDALGGESPVAAAVASELSSEVGRALAEFSLEERQLLVPYLRGERAPAQLAREYGIAPGTVRMRIHRGLERLRLLLPAGAYGIAAFGSLSPRGLHSVRRAVLRRAAELGLPAATTSSVLGGSAALLLAMGKSTLLAGAALFAMTIVGALYLAQAEVQAPSLAPSAPPASESRAQAAGALDGLDLLRERAREEPGTTQAREPSRQRQLAIVGRVRGVRAEHRRAVQVHLVAGLSANEVALKDELARAQGAQIVPCEASRGQSNCALCHGEKYEDPAKVKLRLLKSTLYDNFGRQKDSGIGEKFHTSQDESLLVTSLDDQGNFRFDLGERYAPPGTILPAAFRVAALHPLYVDAECIVSLTAEDRERYLQEAGEVVLRVELELQSAALLRGSVLLDLDRQEAELARVEMKQHELMALIAEQARDDGSEDQHLFVAHKELKRLELMQLLDQIRIAKSATIALFPMQAGRPALQPAYERQVPTGEAFELKIAETGTYALLAVIEGLRPYTGIVELRPLTITQLEPSVLAAGAVLAGHCLVGEPATSASCRVIATRRATPGDITLNYYGHLVWSEQSFEWGRVGSQLAQEGHFHLSGLSPSFYELSVQLDGGFDLLRSTDNSSLAHFLAPATGLTLTPDFGVVEVGLLLGGVPVRDLEELSALAPPTTGGGEGETVPGIRLVASSGDAPDEVLTTLDDFLGGKLSAASGQRLHLRLYVYGVLRDELELMTPPAGSVQRISLELGSH